MIISVIGLGKLGLPFSFFLASKKNNVIGYDVNHQVEKLINKNQKNIEPRLNSYIQKNYKNFTYEKDLEKVVKKTNISFLVLPTPSLPNGSFTNKFILKSLNKISESLKKKRNKKHLIVITSTVSPGSCEDIFIPFLKKKGLTEKRDFLLVYNPHFIAQGSTIYNLEKPDLLLLGCNNKESNKKIKNFYKRIYDPKIFKSTTLRESEIAKISINSYITSKISFANYISELCEKTLNTDAKKVLDVIGQDRRINSLYLKIGTKFSGPCFPRDNLALSNYSKKIGVNSLIPDKNDSINKVQTIRLIRILKRIIKNKTTYNIGICGITYKNDTNIIKNSQGDDLLKHIKKSKILYNKINIYDDFISHKQILDDESKINFIKNKKEFIQQSDIIFIMYDVKNLNFKNYKIKKKKYIVDCWRLIKNLPKPMIKIDIGKHSKYTQ